MEKLNNRTKYRTDSADRVESVLFFRLPFPNGEDAEMLSADASVIRTSGKGSS
jgi:hypothetical protein